MKELLEFIVKSLVSKPKGVKITQETEGEIIRLTFKVDPEDMGLIIGRQGRIIKAIRTLIRTRGLAEKKKVQLFLEEAKK
jgi:predicted RNA-binding protein YlqC (UPF0109 family)